MPIAVQWRYPIPTREVISFGFWAGDQTNPFPAYYSYTAPEPAGLTQQVLRPPPAEWVGFASLSSPPR